VAELAADLGPAFEWPEELREYGARRLLSRLRAEGMIEVYRPANAVGRMMIMQKNSGAGKDRPARSGLARA
jgi:hypothetical protein